MTATRSSSTCCESPAFGGGRASSWPEGSAGGGAATDSRLLARYAVFGVAWSALAACFAVGMSLRYEQQLAQLAPEPVVWAALGAVWVALFMPVIAVLGGPMRERRAQPGGLR